MAELVVDAERCVGCGRCMRACATAGIVVEHRLARPTDGCVLCGSCIEACPVDAISIVRGGASSTDNRAAYRDIWVVAQTDDAGALQPVALELVGKARELADARGCRVTALLAEGAAADDARARELIAAGADEVLHGCDDRFATVDAAVCAQWVCDLAAARQPETILFGATPFGRVLAPAVAVRLRTGLTADCTMLDIDAATGLLRQTRPAFGGNLMATIVCPEHRPQMASVRPGIFPVPERDVARTGTITSAPLNASVQPRVRCRGVERADEQGTSIAQAERLVVVGRGIGSKKNLPLMQHLADLLGAGLGCTRPLVEAGWLSYPHQVGQTGVSVAPKLLVSIGVSGAIQHLAGIGGAETVIAINEDPQAPIFGAARYQVVGDCIEVVRALVAELESRCGTPNGGQ